MNKREEEEEKVFFMSLDMDRKGVLRSQVARKTNGLWLIENWSCCVINFIFMQNFLRLSTLLKKKTFSSLTFEYFR